MALGSLVQAATGASSLKKLLQAQLTSVEWAAHLTSESWLRASALAEICPREEVLCSINKVERKREVSADLSLIFEHGRALHNQLQNSVLPRLGVLLGEWSCHNCGTHVGKQETTAVETWAVRRPEKCANCKQTAFLYHESYYRNEEYRIEGHPDGFLSLSGLPGLGILEAKSISQKGAWQVRNVPNMNHVIQAHVYMWLTGLKWAKVLYWDKGTNGLGGLLEHTLERDEETIERIQKTLRELWRGIESGILPERICVSAEAPRACECAVVKPCFEGFEG